MSFGYAWGVRGVCVEPDRQAADLLVRYLGGDLGIIDLPVCEHLPDAQDTAVNRMHSLNRPLPSILPVCQHLPSAQEAFRDA